MLGANPLVLQLTCLVFYLLEQGLQKRVEIPALVLLAGAGQDQSLLLLVIDDRVLSRLCC
jgi:hypothetical protein